MEKKNAMATTIAYAAFRQQSQWNAPVCFGASELVGPKGQWSDGEKNPNISIPQYCIQIAGLVLVHCENLMDSGLMGGKTIRWSKHQTTETILID